MMNFRNHMACEPQDGQLVRATLAGDRQAFGQIVARYQNLVSGLAYNATGNLAQSEDLAQEIFLAAWKSLASLKEPERLRAWLCGIARNSAANWARRNRRTPGAVSLPGAEDQEIPSPHPSPVTDAIGQEEERILWRAIERIPDHYREPLILYYRDQQSMDAISTALDLSPDAVKQRLSRGRRMLREEVALFVEGALRKSAPGRAFTLGVLAALPALQVSAAAATLGTGAVKGGAAAQTAAGLGLTGAVMGPLLGLLGAYMGAQASIVNTRSARERTFVIRQVWMMIAVICVFGLGIWALLRSAPALLERSRWWLVGASAALLLGYVGAIVGLAIRMNRRQREIRREDGTESWPRGKSDRARGEPRVWEHRSRLTLMGLPVLHLRFGNAPGQGRAPAIGWIAVGDVAVGGLLAIGGVATGVIAFGGVSLGLLGVGGLALGAWAIGGGAFGWEAAGGVAMGWQAAFGGMAVASHYAAGGLAVADQANSMIAREFFRQDPFFAGAVWLMNHGQWLMLLGFLPLLWNLGKARNARSRWI